MGVGKSEVFNTGILVQLCACIALIIIIKLLRRFFLWGLNSIMQVKLLIHYLDYRCVIIQSPGYIIGTNFFKCKIVITLECYNQKGQQVVNCAQHHVILGLSAICYY